MALQTPGLPDGKTLFEADGVGLGATLGLTWKVAENQRLALTYRSPIKVDKGLETLATFNPDAVVMDIRMPGVDGIEGLRRIRALDENVSVIMLTGYGSLETARSVIRLGANDYPKKPFDTVEMLRVVADNVRRSECTRRKFEMERNLHNFRHPDPAGIYFGTFSRSAFKLRRGGCISAPRNARGLRTRFRDAV